MFKRTLVILSIFAILVVISQMSAVHSRDFSYQPISIQKLTRYDEDRIVYQHIQNNQTGNFDNSIATLLIIKDRKMYLIADGYDNYTDVFYEKNELFLQSQLENDLWLNKIDNIPDYILITDRRTPLMELTKQEDVQNKFGNFYKSIRDKFLKKHVYIFRTLMINRRDSELLTTKTRIARVIHDNTPRKFKITARVKTNDEKTYYAEDADGDGITETFTVHIPDGFSWGFKSGANIIFIKNNQQKEITDIIGKLAHDAHYGTQEEASLVDNYFPKEDEINGMIDDIYKSNKIFEERRSKTKGTTAAQ